MCRLRAACVVLFTVRTVAASCAIRSFTMLATVTALCFSASLPHHFEERMQFSQGRAMNSISNLKEAQLPFEFDYVVLSICSPVIDNLLKLILSSFNVSD
jgi:hypothetical protein